MCNIIVIIIIIIIIIIIVVVVVVVQIIMFIPLLHYCTVSVYLCIVYSVVYLADGLFFHKLS